MGCTQIQPALKFCAWQPCQVFQCPAVVLHLCPCCCYATAATAGCCCCCAARAAAVDTRMAAASMSGLWGVLLLNGVLLNDTCWPHALLLLSKRDSSWFALRHTDVAQHVQQLGAAAAAAQSDAWAVLQTTRGPRPPVLLLWVHIEAQRIGSRSCLVCLLHCALLSRPS